MAALKIKNITSNSKRKFKFNKNWVMLVIALLVGGFGIHAANAFIEGQLLSFENKYKTKEEMVELVVPNRDLPKGFRLSASDLLIREVPVSYAHKGAVKPDKYTTALNQRLTYAVAEGRPLLWAHLEGGGVKTFSGRLPEGMRAISFSVDTINSITGFLEPKDKIDLLLTYKDRSKRKVIRPVIQNLLVLATDTRTRVENFSDGQRRTGYGTLTVLVSPENAKRIVLAQSSGKITAVLRNPEDKKNLPKTGMRVSQLFLDGKKNRSRKKRTTGIEFIIGGR